MYKLAAVLEGARRSAVMNTGLAAAMILRRPLTSRAALANELEAQLYAMVANHRPSDFTAVKERHVIDTLIEQQDWTFKGQKVIVTAQVPRCQVDKRQ